METVTRLLDMGCDSFNFSDSMLCIIAKRLCKRLCPLCKQSYHPLRVEYDELATTYGAQAWETLGIPYDDAFLLSRRQGCAACNHSGFKGRVSLHEFSVTRKNSKI